jgi:hypothetical protein
LFEAKRWYELIPKTQLTPSAPSCDGDTVPLSQLLKQKIKDGIVAVSLANLCFVKVEFDLLSDHDRYYNKLPVTSSMLLALVLNLICFASMVWLVMQVLRRFPRRSLQLPFHLAFLLLLLIPVDFVRLELTNIADYQIVAFLKQPVVIIAVLAVSVLVVWKHRSLTKITAVVVGFFSPLALFMFAKIALVCLGVIQIKQCASNEPFPPSGAVRAGQPRVLWIIFDETDYRLAFKQRPPGLQLPEFDRLQQQSLAAANAYSPNDATILSMPALILGRRISSVSDEDACDLSITFADNGKTTTWTAQPSVFSEARSLGFNTALVGWYIPYDRMLGNALNFCAWYPFPSFQPTRDVTFAANMRCQIFSLSETFWLRHLYANICQDSLQTSLRVVTNSTYGLILLHLPPPHKPGVYLPEEHKFILWAKSKVQGYFNNLALADDELGALRHALEASGEWDKTWVILSSDHSWRESRLYDGQRDRRVPFLVKPPGANESMTYSQQFNTVLTHDLILAILHRDVTNQQNVVLWLNTYGSQAATITGGRQN